MYIGVLTLAIVWGALTIHNPYLIAILFTNVLVFLSLQLGTLRKFLGFILFLVYIGGILVLLAYCVMLFPTPKYGRIPIAVTPIIVLVLGPLMPGHCVSAFSFGLLYRCSSILLIALLLYLVILSVVVVVDYSRGIIKYYVQRRPIPCVRFFICFPF